MSCDHQEGVGHQGGDLAEDVMGPRLLAHNARPQEGGAINLTVQSLHQTTLLKQRCQPLQLGPTPKVEKAVTQVQKAGGEGV